MIRTASTARCVRRRWATLPVFVCRPATVRRLVNDAHNHSANSHNTQRSWFRYATSAAAAASITAIALSLYLAADTATTVHADAKVINSKQWLANALNEAAARGDVKQMDALLREHRPSESVNLRHPYGWTPLMAAAANGREQAVLYLLEKGASVNDADQYIVTRRGKTPEQMKSRMDFHRRINPLSSCKGWTPLHYAVAFQHLPVIRALLDANADMELKNADGDDPLHCLEWELLEDGENVRASIEEMFREEKQMRDEKQHEIDRLERLANPLELKLRQLMIGQVWPILSIASAIRRRENGWFDSTKPLVFLFVGSSGVGKTMLAKTLAKEINKENEAGFIRIDMTEFQSKHELAKLIGSPPGYVGFEEGGQLTSKLSQCPDAVVLLDEVEKAHPDVLALMLQVFDEGRLTDGKGNTVDCPNAIFILTSNLVQDEIHEAIESGEFQLRPDDIDSALMKSVKDAHNDGARDSPLSLPILAETSLPSSTMPDIAPEALSLVSSSMDQFVREVVHPILKRRFQRTEFIGRINDIVVFHPLSKKDLHATVEMELNRWKAKARQRHRIELQWSDALINALTQCYDERYGYRSIIYGCEKRVVSLLAAAHERRIINEGSLVELDIESEPTGKSQPRVIIKKVMADAVKNTGEEASKKKWLGLF